MDKFEESFRRIANEMGRNYIANIAIDYMAAVMEDEGYTDKFNVMQVIHKAYTKVFNDKTLPWNFQDVELKEKAQMG